MCHEIVSLVIQLEKNIEKFEERRNRFRWKLVNSTWKRNICAKQTNKFLSVEYEKHYIRLRMMLTENKIVLRRMGVFPRPPSVPVPSSRFIRRPHKK